ncbi:MAG: hypothetical protein FWF94_05880, partial [Oscillospiraceae bacterium]|nr:hypothetical protein [Oscillospiraceae bacterium]
MKKLLSLLLTAAMLCALTLPATFATATTPADNAQTRNADIFDFIDILEDCVGMVELTPVEVYDHNKNGVVDIFDGIIVLEGIIGLGDCVIMPKEKIMLSPCPGCGDERSYFPISIDDDFLDDTIFVVLTHCISIRDNRDWTVEDFKNIGAVVVEDNFRASNENWELFQAGRGNETMINWNQFRRLLTIKLDKHSKENVLWALEQL